MENRVHLYVSRQNFFTRLASVLLMYSLVARVVVFGFTKHAGTVGFWGQIVLPMAPSLLYLFIILADGEECFYKTTIPVGWWRYTAASASCTSFKADFISASFSSP